MSLPTLATLTPRARYDASPGAPKPAYADIQKVRGYDPTPSGLAEALKGSEVVLIPAGVPRKPGMTRDGMQSGFSVGCFMTDGCPDLFNTNASIVRDLAKAAADHAPEANILIISNPVRIQQLGGIGAAG